MFEFNEGEPQPLDSDMVDFLLDQHNEVPWLDFKFEIHVGRGSDFPEIVKDIFAMSNYGGGYLVAGVKEKSTGSFDFIGLPMDFHIDSAVIQEKFNAFSSSPISIYYHEEIRKTDGDNRKFPIIYIPPSSTILVPTKDGTYKKHGKEKVVFKKGDVFVRRGSQSIRASSQEIEWISQRSKSSTKPSILSGAPDSANEVIFGNLAEVKDLPSTIFVGKAFPKRHRTDQIPRFPGPHTVVDGNFYSFLNLERPGFKDRVIQDSIVRTNTDDYFDNESDRDILIRLLNNEIRNTSYHLGLRYQKRGSKFYYPIRRRGAENRKQSWAGRYKKSTRNVVKRFFHRKLNKNIYHHAAVRFRFRIIGAKAYLMINPRIVLSSDGVEPIIDAEAGTSITSLSYNQYNTQYLLNILFWLSILPRDKDGLINLSDRIRISSELSRAEMTVGIRGDLPVKEQAAEFESHQVDIEEIRKLEFHSYYLGEPDLVFGYGQTEKDPRIGLKHFGPYEIQDGTPPLTQVRIGIVGSNTSVSIAKRIIKLLGKEVPSIKPNKWLFPPFPGFYRNTTIDCEFVTSPTWVSILQQTHVKRILEIDDVNQRIAEAANLISDHISKIQSEDNPPTVIICCIPEDIQEYCGISRKTRGAKRPKLTELEKRKRRMVAEGQTFLTEWGIGIDDEIEDIEKSYDLWAALKGRAMDIGIPIQILLESRAKSILDYSESIAETEPPSSFAWNFSTGLYYKASGRPWRLAKLTQGTCYVGIAFYRSRHEKEEKLRTAMAQVFTHSGEGFVLRGGEVSISASAKDAHLTKIQAKSLLLRILERFERHTNAPPSRVVIHKSSFFSDDEKSGLLDAANNIPVDLVAIRDRQGFRFLRSGNYPVLRGTTISFSPTHHLLYTNGYSPRLRTYPGHHVPDPLFIDHQGDSETTKICKEILGLTKLDWNTTAFNKKYPITLAFADKVGLVLAEFPEDKEIQHHYRFYM